MFNYCHFCSPCEAKAPASNQGCRRRKTSFSSSQWSLSMKKHSVCRYVRLIEPVLLSHCTTRPSVFCGHIKKIGAHQTLLSGHWYPCFGLLETCAVGFKARMHRLTYYMLCHLHVMECSGSLLVQHLLTSWRSHLCSFASVFTSGGPLHCKATYHLRPFFHANRCNVPLHNRPYKTQNLKSEMNEIFFILFILFASCRLSIITLLRRRSVYVMYAQTSVA